MNKTFGWDLPPGCRFDSNAPWNQNDEEIQSGDEVSIVINGMHHLVNAIGNEFINEEGLQCFPYEDGTCFYDDSSDCWRVWYDE